MIEFCTGHGPANPPLTLEGRPVMRLMPNRPDTVGKLFEPNAATTQEAGTLTEIAGFVILAQAPVQRK